MSALDDVIAAAYASEGKMEEVNRVYLAFLMADLFMPVRRLEEGQLAEGEEFSPLFAKIDDNYFLLVFDSFDRLSAWAGDQMDQMDYVEISGRDVIAGMSEQVFLCLNVGAEFYKEFSPDEIHQLKMIVAKIDEMQAGEE